jgi:hypothetical protein
MASSKYRVNKDGVAHAHQLIGSGTYDLETGWGEAAPSAADGNREIERHGYEGYGAWHLAI